MISCWKRVGWSNGRISPGSIGINTYSVGKRYRDVSLPEVNLALLVSLFAFENLIRSPSSPNSVPVVRGADGRARALEAARTLVQTHQDVGAPECVMSYVLSKVRDSAATMSSFRLTARMNAAVLLSTVNRVVLETEMDQVDVFEAAEEVLRGAAGRISTANGLMLFVTSSKALLEERKETNLQKQVLAASKEEFKKEQALTEFPVRKVLAKTGFCSLDKMTSAHMDMFATTNSLLWKSCWTRSAKLEKLTVLFANQDPSSAYISKI